MRFVIAIVLFVVAFVTIGLGIAQRTIFAGPPSFEAQVETGTAPITVIDGAVINALPGTQTVSVDGQGEIFLAYGRTSDVLAWVGDLSYNHVTFDTETLLLDEQTVGGGVTPGETVAPTPPADDQPEADNPDPDATGVPEVESFTGEIPDPRGSDLWVQEFDGTDQLIRKINAPEDISLIVMSNGVDPAPGDISITWPLDRSAPLSGPLIIAGIVSLLAGLAAFLWALVHARRRRGPRRKQPRLPRAPQPKRLKRAKQRPALPAGTTVYPAPTTGPIPDATPTPSAGGTTQRRRLRPAMGTAGILIAALALTGCTAGSGVLGSGLEPAPTASADIGDANNLKPPAVTKQQLGRIVARLTDTLTLADEEKDAKLAETRLGGPALEARLANYKMTKKDKSIAAVAPIPAGQLAIVLPQQNDEWSRSVFAVLQPDDATVAPVAMMLVQESPRENYKVHYLITLEPGKVVKPVAPPQIGSVQLDADNNLGLLAPSELAQSYGDVLIKGEEAEHFALFNATDDSLRVDIGFEAKAERKKKLPKGGKIEFSNAANAEPPISFPTNDNGQIVAVALDDTETVKPVEAGAAINTPALVKALSGLARSTKGITATYGVQMLFYVPAVVDGDAGAQIELLGFSSGLVSAKEIN